MLSTEASSVEVAFAKRWLVGQNLVAYSITAILFNVSLFRMPSEATSN
jgi:hypothetical protein